LTYNRNDFSPGEGNQKISQDPIQRGKDSLDTKKSQQVLQQDEMFQPAAMQTSAGDTPDQQRRVGGGEKDPDRIVFVVVALTIAVLCAVFACFWFGRRRQRGGTDQRDSRE